MVVLFGNIVYSLVSVIDADCSNTQHCGGALPSTAY